MVQNIQWAWRVLKAKSFVIATDTSAVLAMPLRDPHSFDSVILLAAQNSSLIEFRDRINELIEEHDRAVEQLFGRSRVSKKKTPTKKTGNKV